MLFEAGGDCSEMLPLAEEPLDGIAIAVEEGTEGRDVLAVGHRLDVGPGAARFQAAAQAVAVAGAIGQQDLALADSVEQPIASSMSAELRPSWACPSVSFSRIGRPLASTSAWILVVGPPRERPMHRV